MSEERPTAVPKGAVWVEDDAEWELGGLSASGKKDGPYRYWRADGTLCNECVMREGVPHGPFKRFHENGEVSQEGAFENGALQGTRTWHATDSETTERMHEDGITEAVWRSEMDYDHGKVIAVRHFDRNGNRLTPSGEPYPERPVGVDASAEYHEDDECWAAGTALPDHSKDGRWRYWSRDGKLIEDTTYVKGAKYGPSKVFDELTASAYAVPGASGLRGDYERGVRVGVWHVLGNDGKRLVSRDFGMAVSEEELSDSPALANQRRSAAEWLAVAESFARERRFGEAVVARARAAARSASVSGFMAAFSELSLATTPEGSIAIAEDVLANEAEDLPALFSGFLRGGSPAMLCRALAIFADKADRGFTALDLINAALLIAPDRKDFLFTRALVLMRLGLPEQVELDVKDLATVEPGSAEFLGNYNRVLFPRFDFWPQATAPDTYYDELPEAPAQSLEAVRSVIAKYARRLTMMRDALSRYVRPDASWVVPDLTDLVSAEELDEPLDLDEAELPDLQRMTRADWSALTWLCWSVGASSVSLPSEIRAPAEFGKACGMAAQRLWRCRDKTLMQGLGAQRSGVPGFVWEGMDIDAMHPALAGIAEQEYAELTAVMRWLSDAENTSPWQDDLRGS